jgi:hypothetical protein
VLPPKQGVLSRIGRIEVYPDIGAPAIRDRCGTGQEPFFQVPERKALVARASAVPLKGFDHVAREARQVHHELGAVDPAGSIDHHLRLPQAITEFVEEAAGQGILQNRFRTSWRARPRTGQFLIVGVDEPEGILGGMDHVDG